MPSEQTDPSTTHPALARLSPRECEFYLAWVRGIPEGKPLKQIADELGIDPRTLSFHKSSVMRKLNASSDFQLMAYGLREGILSIE